MCIGLRTHQTPRTKVQMCILRAYVVCVVGIVVYENAEKREVEKEKEEEEKELNRPCMLLEKS